MTYGILALIHHCLPPYHCGGNVENAVEETDNRDPKGEKWMDTPVYVIYPKGHVILI